MGRKRETRRDERLPPYVYRKPKLNAVEYRPYLGKGKFGASTYLKDEDGKQIQIDPEEWPVLVAAAERLLQEIREHEVAE